MTSSELGCQRAARASSKLGVLANRTARTRLEFGIDRAQVELEKLMY